MRSEATQKRLFAEADLDLDKAVKLSQGSEAAEKSSRDLKGTSSVLTINKRRNQLGAGSLCSRCGRSGHDKRDCKFKDSKCHRCGKIGHIAAACRSKPPTDHHRKPPMKRGANKGVNNCNQ